MVVDRATASRVLWLKRIAEKSRSALTEKPGIEPRIPLVRDPNSWASRLSVLVERRNPILTAANKFEEKNGGVIGDRTLR